MGRFLAFSTFKTEDSIFFFWRSEIWAVESYELLFDFLCESTPMDIRANLLKFFFFRIVGYDKGYLLLAFFIWAS